MITVELIKEVVLSAKLLSGTEYDLQVGRRIMNRDTSGRW